MTSETPYQILAEALRTPYKNNNKTIEKPSFDEVRVRQLLGQMAQSLVASSSRDAWQNWGKLCLSNDEQLLYAAYLKVKDLFAEPVLAGARKRLTEVNSFNTEFSSTTNSEESKSFADSANEITRPLEEMINGTGWNGVNTDFLVGQDIPRTISDISSWLATYCNLPIHLEYNDKNRVSKISVLPPYAWKINSDQKFAWKENKHHYSQFDAMTFQVEQPFYSENIVWASTNHDPDQRYGFPFVYNLAIASDSLRELVDNLSEARIAGSPHFIVSAEGKDGKGFNVDEWMKLFNSLPEQQMALGAKLNPLSNVFNHVFNGKVNADIKSAGTGFFNEFGDADLFIQIIAIGFGVQAALLKGAEKANRATLEFLIRLEQQTKKAWRAVLARSVIFPIYRRALYMARVPTTEITCDIKWEDDDTPEERRDKAAFAKEGWQDGLFAKETAHDIGCSYIGVKPQVDKIRQNQEKVAGVNPPVEQRTNLRISGNKLPQQTDLNKQIIDAFDYNGLSLNN